MLYLQLDKLLMNKDLAIEFGLLVRKIRKEKGISQEHLAFITGIDRSYMGRIERGKVNVTLEKLYQLAKALECEPSDLLP